MTDELLILFCWWEKQKIILAPLTVVLVTTRTLFLEEEKASILDYDIITYALCSVHGKTQIFTVYY